MWVTATLGRDLSPPQGTMWHFTDDKFLEVKSSLLSSLIVDTVNENIDYCRTGYFVIHNLEILYNLGLPGLRDTKQQRHYSNLNNLL